MYNTVWRFAQNGIHHVFNLLDEWRGFAYSLCVALMTCICSFDWARFLLHCICAMPAGAGIVVADFSRIDVVGLPCASLVGGQHERTWRPQQIARRRRHRARSIAIAGGRDPGRPRAADRTHRLYGRQGAAQSRHHGPCRVSRIFAARPVDGHQPRDHVPARRPGSRVLQARLHRQQDLGLLFHHGVQPRRQPLQFRA